MARDGTGWQDLYEALSEADLEFVSSRLPDYPYTDLLRALQVSFEALQDSDDAAHREAAVRYLELAAFQWDAGVPESAVVTIWTGRAGLTERRARRILALLAFKALLRTGGSSPNRRVLLHDLLQDFIRAIAGDLRAEHATLLAAYRSRHPEAPFIPDDGYYLGHYAYHLAEAGQADTLHHLLQRETDKGINAWWQHRLAHGQMAGFADDVTRAWNEARASV